MPLQVSQIKTVNSISAVNRIKSAVKKDGLGLSFDIPKEFIEKRTYMQSDEFLKDKDNVKMFGLFDKLMILRDKITEEISERNKTSKEELVQGFNGFSRIKKYLDINPKMNHSETQSFSTSAESQYGILRKYVIGNESRIIKAKLGK